ncbi:urotensin-2 receptor-like [Bombina bombina]|uniref:urotensin-2 receptor-like n=1 Tax=Bombina bombina TaxID=8345 RepID=UPI00235A5C51|nr:urotensin-2 receptor-like [Bombina bombina]
MEPRLDSSRPWNQKNLTGHFNFSIEASGGSDIAVTSVLGVVLAVMCLVGMSGNTYTLVVMNMSMKFTGSMYIYIVNLALADLLYLATIPFVVCTYFGKNWYFGDIGCRILFSLDLLTMHASIFILTIMSTERYLAVVRPLDTISRSRYYRRTITCLVWLVSFLLALPTMILIDLRTSVHNGITKQMCHPTWQLEAYKIYLTILFHTCILAPGLVICYLYFKMAKTYWKSQSSIFSNKEVKRCPKQKVLYMIFSIVLTYWACFIPFWVWQLLSIYCQAVETQNSSVYVNFVVTCLAYSNSCINPFLYTLLSKNYKEYLRSRHKVGTTQPKKRALVRTSSRKSVTSASHLYTETVVLAQLKGPLEESSHV